MDRNSIENKLIKMKGRIEFFRNSLFITYCIVCIVSIIVGFIGSFIEEPSLLTLSLVLIIIDIVIYFVHVITCCLYLIVCNTSVDDVMKIK